MSEIGAGRWNSENSIKRRHAPSPTRFPKVSSVARPSAIHCFTWSAVAGPYSLPSLPMRINTSHA